MLKSFNPICRGVKKNINTSFGQKILSKYDNVINTSIKISNMSMYSNIVHKSIPKYVDNSNNELIYNILNLLHKMGNLVKNKHQEKNAYISLNIALEYYLDMLRFKNYQEYSLMNSLYSNLKTISNDQDLYTYTKNIQNKLSSFKSDAFKYNYSNINHSNSHTKIKNIRLNSITSPFFYIMNNKSFSHILDNNKDFYSLLLNIVQKEQLEKSTSLKDKFIQIVYNTPQNEAEFLWNLIQNGNIISNDILQLANNSNMSVQENIAFILNNSSTHNFKDFLKLLKNNLSKYKNIKIDNYNKVLQKELKNILSFNFVNSKKQFIDIFNNMNFQEKQKILKSLNIQNDIMEYISNVSMEQYNNNINALKTLNLDNLKEWLFDIDNIKISMYHEVIQDKTIKSLIDKNFNSNFDELIVRIFNSSDFSNYINNNRNTSNKSFKNIFKNYIKSVVSSAQVQRKENISKLIQKIQHKNFNFKELSKEEISQLVEIINSQNVYLSKRFNLSKYDIEQIKLFLEDKQSLINNLVNKINQNSVENLTTQENSQLLDILNSSEFVFNQNSSSDIMNILEDKQSLINNLVNKINQSSIESLTTQENSQLLDILNSSEFVFNQNSSSDIMNILEDKQSLINNLVNKINQSSIESLTTQENSQLLDILNSSEFVFNQDSSSDIMNILEDKQSLINNLVNKINQNSVENLTTQENSQLLDILNSSEFVFNQSSSTDIMNILEDKQSLINNLVNKINQNSVENLTTQENSQLLDILNSSEFVFNQSSSTDIMNILEDKYFLADNLKNDIFFTNFYKTQLNSKKRIHFNNKKISHLKNISIIDKNMVLKDINSKPKQNLIKTLVVEDFPNYLREVPLNYYVNEKSNITLNNGSLGKIDFQYKIEKTSADKNDMAKYENINNIYKKVEDQSKKITALENKVSNNKEVYSLSSRDINNITNDLLNKLNDKLSVENIRRGIF